MFRKQFVLPLICILTTLTAFTQNTSTDPQPIVQKLDVWNKTNPQEKVYLHLNKSLFTVGDTVYCKAYVVNANDNTSSFISSLLYVDLTNDSGTVQKTFPVSLFDGIGWCSFPLLNLKSGSYHIRAYTNWMRNFNGFLFDKSVTILNPSEKSGQQTKAKPYHSIDFFPEGGQMIAGLPARVAFKAIGTNGLGIDVKGSIVDEEGNQVAELQSGFAGMGRFLFKPLPQHTYTAVIISNDGWTEKKPLPKAEERGYALAINTRDAQNILVNVRSKNAPGEVTLIGQSNNSVEYSAKLALTNGIVSVKIAKSKFPTGIAQFTLFDSIGIPVAERLLFINHNDHLNFTNKLDKTTSGKREKMTLTMHVTDESDEPVLGSFSVAVTEAATAPYDESKDDNIVSHLLLTSDLKGYVESPAYYFTNVDSNKVNELDNLLLTQGWRRFRWQEVLANGSQPLPFAAEKNLSLQGMVKSERGKPLTDATVTLLSKSGNGMLWQTKTDSAGNFIFDSLMISSDAPFTVQAARSDGSKNVVISLKNFSPVTVSYNLERGLATNDSSITSYVLANEKQWNQRKELGLISDNDVNVLQPVTVTTEKLTKIQQAVAPSYNLNGPGHADQILTYDDMQECRILSQCLPGKLTGITFKSKVDPNGIVRVFAYSSRGFGTPMMIMVDGIAKETVDDIPATAVQSIEVLRSAAYSATYGFAGAAGVIVITTKQGNLDYNHLDNAGTANKNILFTTLHGYAVSREFYSPDYSSNNTSLPDLRSTLYWQPNVVTDEDGNATLSWYNSDVTGQYHVVIEGISNNGKIGNTSLSYEVK